MWVTLSFDFDRRFYANRVVRTCKIRGGLFRIVLRSSSSWNYRSSILDYCNSKMKLNRTNFDDKNKTDLFRFRDVKWFFLYVVSRVVFRSIIMRYSWFFFWPYNRNFIGIGLWFHERTPVSIIIILKSPKRVTRDKRTFYVLVIRHWIS